jgi:hypothetical protein
MQEVWATRRAFAGVLGIPCGDTFIIHKGVLRRDTWITCTWYEVGQLDYMQGICRKNTWIICRDLEHDHLDHMQGSGEVHQEHMQSVQQEHLNHIFRGLRNT